MLSPVIYTNKVSSPSYNGGYYTCFRNNAGSATVGLNYTQSTGQFSVTRTSSASSNFVTPFTGTWTSSPTVNYEAFVTVVSQDLQGTANISGTGFNTWVPIISTVNLCRLTVPSISGIGSVVFSITLRKIGATTPVVVTTIRMEAEVSL